jgi:hypothetical protein
MVIVYIRPLRLVCELEYRRRLDILNFPCYLKLNSKEILAIFSPLFLFPNKPSESLRHISSSRSFFFLFFLLWKSYSQSISLEVQMHPRSADIGGVVTDLGLIW